MKKLTLMIGLSISILFIQCKKENTPQQNTSNGNCGWYNNKETYKGTQGGCYYWNSNNNKTYIDAQYCPC